MIYMFAALQRFAEQRRDGLLPELAAASAVVGASWSLPLPSHMSPLSRVLPTLDPARRSRDREAFSIETANLRAGK
jgi:hypothetical protein